MKLIKIAFITFCLSLAASAQAVTVTVFPDSPDTGNCYPFGGDDDVANEDPFNPFMGFVYQNVPAFSLAPGNTIAFDLGEENETIIELDIELAATTVNGGNVPSGSYTKVVSNFQHAADPNGDDVVGNFELVFVAEQGFNFAGGGLIIRFSNESPAFAADNDCDGVLVHGDNGDSSGFFVERWYRDANGLPPYNSSDTGQIGAFEINTDANQVGIFVAPPEPLVIPSLNVLGQLLLTLTLALAGWVVFRRQ